jgi:hypothetical protein
MRKTARELTVGDVFFMEIYGEVVALEPVANGKRIKIQIALQDQRQLEFTDAGHVLEFLWRPGRSFPTWGDDDDDDDGGDDFTPAPSPEDELVD